LSEKVEASQKTLKRYEERLEELGVNVKSFKEVVAFLQEQLDMMAFYWSFEKLAVCDIELTESWIVETLKPDNAQAFFSALDMFSLCWQVFSDKFEGLVDELQKRKREYKCSKAKPNSLIAIFLEVKQKELDWVLARLGVEAEKR